MQHAAVVSAGQTAQLPAYEDAAARELVGLVDLRPAKVQRFAGLVVGQRLTVEGIEPQGTRQPVRHDVFVAHRVLEAHDVMRRGDPFAVMLARGLADLVVIVLVVTAQRITEVVGERVAGQFIGGAQAVVAHDELQFGRAGQDFRFAVQVEVDRGDRRARLQAVEGRLQGDQVVPDGAPQVRQVEAAKEAVPVRVVGLGAVERRDQLGRRVGQGIESF